jgi:hypothetical protein
MNTYSKDSKFPLWLMALALTGLVSACGGSGSGGGNGSGSGSSSSGSSSSTGPAGASPSLGRSAGYAMFAANGAGMTLDPGAAGTGIGHSSILANIGLDPVGSACIDCTTTTVSGSIDNGNQAEMDGLADFNAAYANALSRKTDPAYTPCTVAGDLEQLQPASANCTGLIAAGPGPTNSFKPGLYVSGVAIGIGVGATITLDAGGNADAVFIFQTDSALTTGTTSVVVLSGGAMAKNVWWIVGSAATLGVSSTFKGTVIAAGPSAAAMTVKNGTALAQTDVEGRLFSSGAAATVGGYATVHLP